MRCVKVVSKSAYMLHAAPGVLALFLLSSQASAQSTIDDVLKRLDAVEKSNAKLKKENEALRERVNKITPANAATARVAPLDTALPQGAMEPTAGSMPKAGDPPKSNPVTHVAVAAPPAGGLKDMAIGDSTKVSIYGHADLSFDYFNTGVFDQGWKPGIASNGSYFGVRARHDLTAYGHPGWAFVLQYEEQVDAAAAPTERAAFGTRDSFLGVESPYGALKFGKVDTPYKKATGAFDPFANTVGDYNSIMGNTGGDNRAEFDWRMNHSVWYESPIWSGFQFSALFSPGQNFAKDNSDYSYGDYFQCNGASTRGSGSNFPGTGGAVPGNIGGNGCTDGSYGDAFSVAAVYKTGPFTAIAAYELHRDVNRHGDDGLEPGLIAPVFLPDGSQVITGVHDEWAAKVGGGYRIDKAFGGPLQLYSYYEWMRRDGAPAAFNERSRDGVFVSATQYVGEHWEFSASYAHAFKTPGNPTCLSLDNANAGVACTTPGPIVQAGQFQANKFDDSADMYALGTRYRFNKWASWYLVGAELNQGDGAHYCLGPSGHGYQLCSRDAANDTIGGATIKAVSTGLTFDF
jgi:predicted porin